MGRKGSAVALVLLILSIPGQAWAHGDLRGTDPEDGSRLKKPPTAITLTLTEAPAKGSVMTVRDGCGRKVPGEVFIEDRNLAYSVSGGEPGSWHASYRAISAQDGHLTQGGISFTVAGKKDCSKEPDDSPTDQIGGGADTRVNAPDQGDDGSSFPIVPFAIGTLVVVAAALLLRRSSSAE